MIEDHHHAKGNDKHRLNSNLSGQQLQHDALGLTSMMHAEDGMDNLGPPDSDAIIPATVAHHQSGLMCGDERYEKYKYEKYDVNNAPEFNTITQRYLTSDMGIAGQGQLGAGQPLGLHGFKDGGLYTLAPHPFSIQRLLPGTAEAKNDVKMFDMSAYGGYASLGSGPHGIYTTFSLRCSAVQKAGRILRRAFSRAGQSSLHHDGYYQASFYHQNMHHVAQSQHPANHHQSTHQGSATSPSSL